MGSSGSRVAQGIPFGAGFGPFARAPLDSGVSVLAIVLHTVVWLLLILAACWVVYQVLAVIRGSRTGTPRHARAALAELELLYARGEVSRADYMTRRADLSGQAPPVPPPA